MKYESRLRGIAKRCGAVLLLISCAMPLSLYIFALVYLPQFHHFVRALIGNGWTYHIADSGVTIGLAYYLVLAFLLWRARLTPYRWASKLMEIMQDTIDYLLEENPESRVRPNQLRVEPNETDTFVALPLKFSHTNESFHPGSSSHSRLENIFNSEGK